MIELIKFFLVYPCSLQAEPLSSSSLVPETWTMVGIFKATWSRAFFTQGTHLFLSLFFPLFFFFFFFFSSFLFCFLYKSELSFSSSIFPQPILFFYWTCQPNLYYLPLLFSPSTTLFLLTSNLPSVVILPLPLFSARNINPYPFYSLGPQQPSNPWNQFADQKSSQH